MTVRELLARMDSRELSEWIAYDRIEPFGRMNWWFGMLASVIANCFGSKKRKFTPDDFTLGRKRKQHAPLREQMNIAARFHAALSKKGEN